MNTHRHPASGAASAHRYNLAPSTTIFKTRITPCRNAVRADVGPFCRKGLRSPAATCDQTSFNPKIMSPEITAPLFVVPCDIPLSVRLAANRKILSGRKDLQKSPNHTVLRIAFPIRHPASLNHRAS